VVGAACVLLPMATRVRVSVRNDRLLFGVAAFASPLPSLTRPARKLT